jgi:antitoxin (DNA-binding transcriptional repressor) of toxin-antitoxin stability system
MTTTVGSRELKTRLGTYIRRIKEGATIVLTERGRPVGEIRPIRQNGGTTQDRLDRLAALGVVTRGSGRALRPFRPLRCPRRALSSAVLEGRKERV